MISKDLPIGIKKSRIVEPPSWHPGYCVVVDKAIVTGPFKYYDRALEAVGVFGGIVVDALTAKVKYEKGNT